MLTLVRGSIRPLSILIAPLAAGCADTRERGEEARQEASSWIELFNGRDLAGWTPKIRGEALGEDRRRTFRVEDGLLTVSYDAYDETEGFSDTFGHLFFEEPLESYELLVEYRFVGRQFEGGPGWARSNSGVMFHAQVPGTMGVDQDFPISLEAQFLGGEAGEVRPTANLCTPGTHVEIEGDLVTAHCVNAEAPTVPDSTWVTVTIVAHADGSVRHLVDGDTVIAYEGPVVGGGEVSEWTDGAPQPGLTLRGGYIALQSESHPIQFRRVAWRPLSPP
ncbi:MAG: 3-keto-disaccharide hydrolase [Longimicrobiales bacterium]